MVSRLWPRGFSARLAHRNLFFQGGLPTAPGRRDAGGEFMVTGRSKVLLKHNVNKFAMYSQICTKGTPVEDFIQLVINGGTSKITSLV